MKALILSRLLHFINLKLLSLFMMQALQYQGVKVEKSNQKITNDSLVVEAPLQININSKSFTVVMRTPNHDFDLVRGLLYAEDIYKDTVPLDVDILEENENGTRIIDVKIPSKKLGKGYLNKRSLLSVSSCGICGKQDISSLQLNNNVELEKASFQLDKIQEMFYELQKKQEVFKVTGGSHAAGIFSEAYQLLCVREDIGRHNAVDKCIGNLLNQDLLYDGKILLVSGRVSYEIITKAFLAKIPLVVAVSACSSLAVDFAKEFGICLIGFTRENKMTIYSNPDYIKS